MRNYYVYVYIDPRNNEEFYYGKGCGNRQSSHLKDKRDSATVRRIKAIQKEEEKPIIKIIAADLTEEQAYLVESTLIWKFGKNLTNAVSGIFASKFRPHNTLHKDLPGFDFDQGIYLVNVGECCYRCWKDSRKYGFLSAGHGRKYSEQLERLQSGDMVVAFLNKHGYVGVGVVQESLVCVKDFKYRGMELRKCKLTQPNIFENADNPDESDYLVKVEWKKTVDSSKAKWRSKAGLFSTRLVCASLANQTKTLKFLEDEFRIKFQNYIRD